LALTGSGKTFAAACGGSIGIVYLSPLRALAVDVKRRTGGHRVNTLAGHGGL
jgi:Lhr-like helicase